MVMLHHTIRLASEHSVISNRLLQMARGEDAAVRQGAVNALLFMQEQGVLLALRDEKGPVGALAADAYHRLLNPVVVLGARDFKSEEK